VVPAKVNAAGTTAIGQYGLPQSERLDRSGQSRFACSGCHPPTT